MSDGRGAVTNVDRRNGRAKKVVWFVDSEDFPTERDGSPSRYGPTRVYLCNAFSVADASRIVALWNGDES